MELYTATKTEYRKIGCCSQYENPILHCIFRYSENLREENRENYSRKSEVRHRNTFLNLSLFTLPFQYMFWFVRISWSWEVPRPQNSSPNRQFPCSSSLRNTEKSRSHFSARQKTNSRFPVSAALCHSYPVKWKSSSVWRGGGGVEAYLTSSAQSLLGICKAGLLKIRYSRVKVG
jgi:hypothetical protein